MLGEAASNADSPSPPPTQHCGSCTGCYRRPVLLILARQSRACKTSASVVDDSATARPTHKAESGRLPAQQSLSCSTPCPSVGFSVAVSRARPVGRRVPGRAAPFRRFRLSDDEFCYAQYRTSSHPIRCSSSNIRIGQILIVLDTIALELCCFGAVLAAFRNQRISSLLMLHARESLIPSSLFRIPRSLLSAGLRWAHVHACAPAVNLSPLPLLRQHPHHDSVTASSWQMSTHANSCACVQLKDNHACV